MQPFSLTIHQAAALLRKRELSAQELTRSVLDRIATLDAHVHAYLTVSAQDALHQAATADALLSSPSPPPLCGIPVAIKDVILTQGVRSTAGSKILANFIPPYDATVVQRLRTAGAILLGKANCDEFAMGSSNEHSAFGPTLNPWDRSRVPGGSSGGSAAAVAADLALASLGTDTGGSIRLPAAFCGVVGLKPTYGRVSRFGVIAYASSLDQVGPFTKDVTDAALLLQALAAHDPQDATSANIPAPDYLHRLANGVDGLRIGIPSEYFVEGMQPEVQAAVEKAIAQLTSLGARPIPISLPHTAYAIATYYIIATAEASSNLSRYDGMKYGYRTPSATGLEATYYQSRAEAFGSEAKRRIVLGTYVLSAGYYDAYYVKAQKVRTLIRQDFIDAFAQCDIIATPVAPTTAFRLGEKTNDPFTMYLSDILTIAVNLSGLPALSLPCGFDDQHLPIGLQLIGQPFKEDILLQTAYAYEQTTPWHTRKPSL